YQLSRSAGVWVWSFLLQKYISSFLPYDHLHKIIYTPRYKIGPDPPQSECEQHLHQVETLMP
ncbi:hypothetical protein, partial [Nitrosomonas sp.]|uniref:hypothetical protein n=1 Tax=Nitrosomonas sp. TaxID=42353 RepID=UPI0032EC86E5